MQKIKKIAMPHLAYIKIFYLELLKYNIIRILKIQRRDISKRL